MPRPIEPADVADAGEILELQKRAYQSEAAIYDDYGIPPLTQTLDEIRAEFETYRFLKAVCEGRIVGSVRARKTDGGACYIGRLIVDPLLQGQGIGKRLMAAIEREFDSAPWYDLFTGHISVRNLRFYAGQGYREVGREQVNAGLELVHLRKVGQGTARVG
jgi:ribosomal protein S18 acetylase RimI-like enzyme